MSHLRPDETRGGNTRTPLVQWKNMVFTFNNPPPETVETLETTFKRLNIEYIFQGETGESGTPHIQGYIECPKKMRWSSFHLDDSIHWEKRAGTRQQARDYCCKADTRTPEVCPLTFSQKLKPPRQLQLITPGGPGYEWQQVILDKIREEPDNRTIHWLWSECGGVGKTQFCKYLTVKHDAICLSGKGADVRNGILEFLKTNGETPDLVLVNVPRSHSDYLSYEALENIKDMYFYSGKYEGGQVCGPCPHLFVFANCPPKGGMLSEDRYNVTQIDRGYMGGSAPQPPPQDE